MVGMLADYLAERKAGHSAVKLVDKKGQYLAVRKVAHWAVCLAALRVGQRVGQRVVPMVG